MQSEEKDKTEKATPYKLKQARDKGQVAKSQDINAIAVFVASFFAIYFFGESMLHQTAIFFERTIILSSDLDLTIRSVNGIFNNIVSQFAQILWPFVIFVFLVVVAANFAQVGPIFSLHSIKPDPKRLNPVQGFKKIMSIKSVIEFFKVLIRFFIMVTISLFLYDTLSPDWFSLAFVESKYYPMLIMQQILYLIAAITLAYIIVALADFIYVKWDYMKKMMMSRRELKEEFKRREGDPDIKAKRKELQRQYAQGNRSLNSVEDADVIVTNPTHIAVALSYKKEEMFAPIIVAKGKDLIAIKIKELAKKYSIPVVENKILARELVKYEVSQAIPSSSYADVAKILATLVRRKRGLI